jgi:protein-arginine kinase activator protein McsA
MPNERKKIMKMKKLMAALLAGILTVGSVIPASAAWVQSGSDWRYQNEDGSWQTGKWFQEAGKWYHFDASGNAQKGWFKDADGKWYFLAYNGIMQTGLIKVDNNVYFMDADGSLYVGTMKINEIDYNFTEYGTTNGKPYVGTSQTWGGNGNQTDVVVGGRGYSSSSSSNSDNTSVVKKEIDKVIADIAQNISAVNGDPVIITEVKGSNIEIKALDSTTKVGKTDLVEQAESMIIEILENENVKEVTYNGKTYSNSETDISKLQSKMSILAEAYSEKTVEQLVSEMSARNIKVTLINGNSTSYSVVNK